MRSDVRGDRVVITLHEADKRVFAKVRRFLRFIVLNADSGEVRLDAGAAGDAIDAMLAKLCAETPEDDTEAAA